MPAELDRIWEKLDTIDKRQSGMETRMGLAEQARDHAARQADALAKDIRDIKAAITDISITLATARGGLWVGRGIGLALAGVIGWLASVLHIGLR